MIQHFIDKIIERFTVKEDKLEEKEILIKLRSFIESFLSIEIEDLHFMMKTTLLSDFQVIVKDIILLQIKKKTT